MKMCSTCNRELAADDFYANAATKDGRDTVCRECRNRGVNLARLSRRVATWRPGMRKTREEYLAELEALRAEYEDVTGRQYVPRNREVSSRVRRVTVGVIQGQQEAIDQLVARVDELQAEMAMLRTTVRGLSVASMG